MRAITSSACRAPNSVRAASRGTETFPSVLVGRLRDDAAHHGALVGSVGENACGDNPQRGLGQAPLHNLVQFQQGGHRLARNPAAGENL